MARALPLHRLWAPSRFVHICRVVLATWTTTHVNGTTMNERAVVKLTTRTKVKTLAHLFLLTVLVKCNHPLGRGGVRFVFGFALTTLAFASLALVGLLFG